MDDEKNNNLENKRDEECINLWRYICFGEKK
jgi:hypothetical protein